VLTLPMAGYIKKYFPQSKIYFLGRAYTKDIIALSEHVDGFLNYDEMEKAGEAERIEMIRKVKTDVFIHVFPKKEIALLAKKAEVPLRVGTTNRLYHWFTCNKVIRLSRKNSPLHEAQLNMKLLSFLNIPTDLESQNVKDFYGFTRIPTLDATYASWIDPSKINVILHPKSKGSAREWGLENFSKLISLLPKDKFKIFISGTKEDGEKLRDLISQHPDVNDLTGKLSLQQFIAFIAHANALVAASTGPLHIAAALGKKAIGLFSSRRPIHPGRWMPLGERAAALVHDPACETCRQKKDCDCIQKINPQQIVDLLLK
jgi:ADP-heptose:LPS heptosyltransferase